MKKNVTITDIAEKAGVSKSTVSRVINGKAKNNMKPETKERVEKIMSELNYYPNQTAQTLSTKKSYNIGLVLSDISNDFYSSLALAAEREAAKYNYTISIFNTDELKKREEEYFKTIFRRQFDGIILAPTGKNVLAFEEFKKKQIPFVFVDRYIKGINTDAVLSDNFDGAYQAVKYITDMGHKKIGIILGRKRNISTSSERFNGYCKALQDASIKFNPKLVVRGNSRIDGGFRACKKLLDNNTNITAIFCINNLMTLGALKAIQNYKIPEDISIVGFDKLVLAEILEPRLTLVEQKPDLMGKQAVKLLLKRIDNENTSKNGRIMRIPTKLSIRDSVKKI